MKTNCQHCKYTATNATKLRRTDDRATLK